MTPTDALNRALVGGLKALQIAGADALVAPLGHYVSALEMWNRTYNLTSIRDPLQMVPLHILDSLSVAPFITAETILDVGSGAGLPGIPLAMLMPERQFTLLDSNGKKTRFLLQMKIELGLDNLSVVNARVESHKGLYGQVVCRAFASLDKIIEQTRHLLAPAGTVLAMKGKEEALKSPLDERVKIHLLDVPGVAAERHVYVIDP